MISRCMNCVLYSRTVLMNSQACKQVKFWMISQATDLSHLITIVWKDSKSSQHMSKLSKVIQSSRSIWLIRIVPQSSKHLQAECAQVRPQRQYLRTSLVESWYEPSRQVFDLLHHVAPCCTHHFHAAVALAVRVLMQTGNWSSQCLCPELEYTYYLLRLVFLTRGFMIFSAEVSARFYSVNYVETPVSKR